MIQYYYEVKYLRLALCQVILSIGNNYNHNRRVIGSV